jgi:ankyrin repeat protein
VSCCSAPSEEDLELEQELAKLKHRPEVADQKSVKPFAFLTKDKTKRTAEEERRQQKLQEEYGSQLHAECKSPKVDVANLRRIVSTCPDAVRHPTPCHKEYALHLLCKNKKTTPEMVHYIAYEWPMAARHASNNDASLPLHYACESQLPFSVIKYILDLYEQANSIPNEMGMWPIHLACFHECDAVTIDYMLQLHPDKHLTQKRTKGGVLPLHLAAEFPKLSVLEVLVECDPKTLQETCPEGNTPLHLACANDASFESIEYLTKSYKPAIAVANNRGDLPLHVALKEQTTASSSSSNKSKSSKKKRNNNKLRVITYLVENHWNATVTINRNGNLPIHIACGNKAGLKLIEYLVGVSPDSLKRQTTGTGLTPLHVACQVKASLKVITYLVHQWKDALQIPTHETGQLPIHVACQKQCPLPVVQFLVRRWPDCLKKLDAEGKTPAVTAAAAQDDDDEQDDESEYEEVVKWIRAVAAGKLPIQPSLREQLSSRQFSFR